MYGYISHFISCWAPASPPIPKCRLPRRLRLARAAGAGAGADDADVDVDVDAGAGAVAADSKPLGWRGRVVSPVP